MRGPFSATGHKKGPATRAVDQCSRKACSSAASKTLKSVGFGTTESTSSVAAMVASFAQGARRVQDDWRVACQLGEACAIALGGCDVTAIDAVGNDGIDGLSGQSHQRFVVRGVHLHLEASILSQLLE